MDDKLNDLEEEYRNFFYPFNEEYFSATRQAESFKIVSVLKNVSTDETPNSVLLTTE